jgi:multiple sugar transport system permease protein
VTPWLFVLPGLAFTFIWRYWTLGHSLWISLHRYEIPRPPGRFVWLQNYLALFRDPSFWQAATNTLVFTALTLGLVFLIPLIQALFLSETRRGRSLFSTLYLIPALIPLSVTVIIWKWIFSPNYGLANYLIGLVGIQAQTWYSNPGLTKQCIVIPGMIGGGFGVLLYLSAILSVPQDIIESAQLEGCSGLQRLWYITLPHVRFLVMIQLALTVIGVMQILDQPLQFAHGGPNGASTSLAYLVYDQMQVRYDYGRSTAAAFVLLIIIAAATALQMKLDRTERDE